MFFNNKNHTVECLKSRFHYLCKNFLKSKLFRDLRVLATLNVHTYMSTININNVSIFISCKTKNLTYIINQTNTVS